MYVITSILSSVWSIISDVFNALGILSTQKYTEISTQSRCQDIDTACMHYHLSTKAPLCDMYVLVCA